VKRLLRLACGQEADDSYRQSIDCIGLHAGCRGPQERSSLLLHFGEVVPRDALCDKEKIFPAERKASHRPLVTSNDVSP